MVAGVEGDPYGTRSGQDAAQTAAFGDGGIQVVQKQAQRALGQWPKARAMRVMRGGTGRSGSPQPARRGRSFGSVGLPHRSAQLSRACREGRMA